MSKANDKIFIGYREGPSLWQAYSLYYYLSNHNRTVYMDKENPKRGKWRSNLEDLILASEHYVLILDKSSFSQQKKGEDILLWEIKLALKNKRNIVQFYFNGFNPHNKIHTKYLPQEINEELRTFQHRAISKDNVTSGFDDARRNLLVPKDITTTPLPIETRNELLIKAFDNTLGIPRISISNLSSQQIVNMTTDSDDVSNARKFADIPGNKLNDWVEEVYLPYTSSRQTAYVEGALQNPLLTLELLPRENGKYASIKVHNHSNKPIECKSTLKKIEKWSNGRWQQVDAIYGNERLTWHGGGGIKRKIDGRGFEFLNLAKYESEYLLIFAYDFKLHTLHPE